MKLEPGSLLVLVCAPPLVRRAVPGQVSRLYRMTSDRTTWPEKIMKEKSSKQQAPSNKLQAA